MSVWVSVWVCCLWVCIFASCVWMPDLLPLVGKGSSFALFLPTNQPEPRGQLGQKPLLQPPEIAGRLAPTGHSRAVVGLPPDLGSPSSPWEGVEVPAGRGASELSSLCSRSPAPGLPACACGAVCVCVSHANPPSPNRPPQNSLPFHTNLEIGFLKTA